MPEGSKVWIGVNPLQDGQGKRMKKERNGIYVHRSMGLKSTSRDNGNAAVPKASKG